MTINQAFIYEQPDADPVAGRFVLYHDGQQTTYVPVPDASLAPRIAADLVDSGARVIELSGGFPMTVVAQVFDAVGGRVSVEWASAGSVTGTDSSTAGSGSASAVRPAPSHESRSA
jgi:hypothetical protein